jgi:hypothetical protein
VSFRQAKQALQRSRTLSRVVTLGLRNFRIAGEVPVHAYEVALRDGIEQAQTLGLGPELVISFAG